MRYLDLFYKVINKHKSSKSEVDKQIGIIALLEDENKVQAFLASSLDVTINEIDKMIMEFIYDYETLKEYFTNRFSNDFKDICKTNNPEIGRCALHIIDSYEKKDDKTARGTKNIVCSTISKRYDGKTVPNKTNLNRQIFRSTENVASFITAKLQESQQSRNVDKTQIKKEDEILTKVIEQIGELLPEAEQTIENNQIKVSGTVSKLYSTILVCNQLFKNNSVQMVNLHNDVSKYIELEKQNRLLISSKKVIIDKLYKEIDKNPDVINKIEKLSNIFPNIEKRSFALEK